MNRRDHEITTNSSPTSIKDYLMVDLFSGYPEEFEVNSDINEDTLNQE